MKTRIRISSLATLLLVTGALTTRAATNYWDNNGTTAGFGAAGGTWGTEQKWSTDGTGVAAPGTTTTTTSDDLHFGLSVDGLSAGAVTVSGAAQGFGSISFGQASGEITLSGGTLNLAAGVSSLIANNASNTIGSVLTGGALHKPGRLHHTAFLTTTAGLVFPNARLADYKGADGIMGGGSITGGSRPAQAYHFSNDGSTCTYQLQQILDTPWTKCVKVELTQVGADIHGRALYAKYINNGGVLGLDFDLPGPAGNAIATSYAAGGYGAAETILTTSGEYLFFLTTSPVTILSNATLTACTGADGIMGGGFVTGGSAPADAYHFSNDGSTATYQLQAYNGGHTKCVKVELTQSGADIAARAVYAKYLLNQNSLGFDFDTGGNNQAIAISYAAGGYGAAETTALFVNEGTTITLTGVNTYSGGTTIGGGTLEIGGGGQLGSGSYAGNIRNQGQLLYNSSSNQVLSGAISSTGSVVKGTAGTYSSLSHWSFLTSVAATIFPNATLSDYQGADGVMGGAAVASTLPFPADAYHFSNNGSTATFQLQIYDGGHTKCVKVELTQVGPDIAGRVLYAKYLLSQDSRGFDFDLPGPNNSGIATSYTAGGYGAAEITVTTHDNSKLTLSAASSYSGGTVVNVGILEAISSVSSVPSGGGITVGSGGHLRLNVGGMVYNNAGGVGNGNPITVNSGGRFTLAGGFNAGYSRPITINGGTLNSTASDGDNSNYMNDLTLQSGALVAGRSIRVGNFTAASIGVSGTSASSIPAGIRLVNTSGGARPLTLNVADATGDANVDLTISGVIWDFTGLTGMPIIKTGAGTVEFSGVNTYLGLTTVTAGTLALGADNTLDGDNAIVLNGGGLDTGDFNNTVGTLTVNGSSHMILGDGELAFADTSGVAWTGTLTLTGTLRDHTLRFGNDDGDLTVAQLHSINIEGNPVYIDDDGYLLRASNGTLFMIR